jgi:adenylate cyclase
VNRGTKLKIKQLQVIIGTWLVMGFLITVYDYLVLHTFYSKGPSEDYSFLLAAFRNMGAALIGALLGGSFLVFYINVKYQDKPYGYTIIAVSLSFLLIIAFIAVIMGLIIVPLRTGEPMSNPASRAAFIDFLKDPAPLKAVLVWSFIVAITQLMLQVNSKFGQADFWDIIRGKYNSPIEAKRIFMCVDLNSSTTIAEQLGDEAYHALLKDFFADITPPIIENKGNIYQYVGDEVVIAWKYEDGKENMNCLKCFFDMKLQIQKKKEKYLQRYGLVPSFKAGIHCGRVIAGEIGIIKRDITYSGDVLNTTSRILSKCEEFKAEVIASSDLLKVLYEVNDFATRPLGSIKLKGKEKEILLHALIPASI